MSDVNLQWNGEQVKRDMLTATKMGINSTLIECVKTSKELVRKRTTILQGSIHMEEARTDKQGEVFGRFGSYNNNYAIHIEFGTKPHLILSKGSWPLRSADAVFGQVVHHPGTRGWPFLRPSADHHFPSLAHRIAAYLGAYG